MHRQQLVNKVVRASNLINAEELTTVRRISVPVRFFTTVSSLARRTLHQFPTPAVPSGLCQSSSVCGANRTRVEVKCDLSTSR